MKRAQRRKLLTYLIPVLAAVVGFGAVALYVSRQAGGDSRAPQIQATPAAEAGRAAAAVPPASPTPAGGEGDSVLETLFGTEPSANGGVPGAPPESLSVTVPRVFVRLALAALLATVLAFRPRKDMPLLQRNPYVAQTQILLAVVASSLMMIVGDSAARAFGIFAAASLVRFRTNIRDPKETTVLLISLALGLATGVGRWELALILAAFVLPLLWALEYYEVIKINRAMSLTVKTRNTSSTQAALKRIFRRHRFTYELRQLDPPDADEPVGCLVYFVNISVFVST
ncbi:MAG: DUF4956 domain-containing protein, partial [Pyrinomonadaceae bacterium]